MNKQRKEEGRQDRFLSALNPASFHFVAGIACLVLLACLTSLTTRGADTLYIENRDLMISTHDTLFCAGDIILHNDPGRISSIDNNGHIVLENNFFSTVPHLFEKTSLSTGSPSGNLFFMSGDNSLIQLIEPSYLYNLNVWQTKLHLLSSLTIVGKLSMDRGRVNQQGYNLYFYQGEGNNIIYGEGIQLEDNLNYIYNSHDSGYMEFKHLINSNDNNICNAGFLFYDLGDLNRITLRRYNYTYTVASPVLNRYFELKSEVTGINIDIGFTWFDSLFVDAAAAQKDLALWHKLGRFPHPYSVVNDTLQQVHHANVNLLDGVYAIASANCDFPYQSDLPDSQVICLGDQSQWYFHAGIPDEEQTSYQYTWSANVPLPFPDSSSAMLSLPDSLLAAYAGQFIQINLNIMDTMGCWIEDSVLLHVRKPQDMALVVADAEGLFRSNFCQYDTLLLLDTVPKSIPGTYTWKTGDGYIEETFQPQMPYHYSQHGRYHIEAYFTDQYACVSHATYLVPGGLNIHPQPELHSLFAHEICAGEPWTFQSQAWVNPSPFYSQLLQYHYELDGESFSFDVRDVQADPGVFEYVFEEAGTYELFHKVESNAACAVDTGVSITVYPALSLSFDTSVPVCQHTDVEIAVEKHSDTPIRQIVWEIDGSSLGGDSLRMNWQFDTSGESRIAYYAEDANGCNASGVYSVVVLKNPFPVIHPLRGKNGGFDYCVGDEVELLEVSDNAYRRMFWVHGEDTLSSSSFTTSYQEAGIYPVELHVESANTCQNAAFDTLHIWDTPASSVVTQALCLNEQKDQQAISFEYRFPDENFVFDFGDGYFSDSPEHLYEAPGDYFLRVEKEKSYTGFSCKKIFFDTLRILPIPHAGFSTRDSLFCVQDSIHLLNHPQIFSQPLEKLVWHINDSAYYSSAEVFGYSYLPENEGVLHIVQEVYNIHGCMSSYASQREVFPSPDFSLQTRDICLGEELQTSVVHAITSDGHRRTRWQLMEENRIVDVQEGDHFAFTPTSPGSYAVFADVTNQHACTQRKQTTVEIFPLPQIYPLSDFTTCDSLFHHSIDSQYVVRWHDGKKVNDRLLYESGNYWYTALDTVTGCALSDSFSISLVTPLQVELEKKYEACGQVMVNPGLPFFYTYRWSDSSADHRNTIRHSGDYSLTVTDFSGCTATASFEADITPIPEVHIPDTFYCEGSNLLLEVPVSDTRLWSTGDTTRQLKISTSGDYAVTLINAGRCQHTSYFTVHERALPNPGLQDTVQQCGSTPVQLRVIPGMKTYKWNDDFSGRNRLIEASGLFIIEVQDPWGCVAFDSVVVLMHQLPEIALEESTALCSGTATSIDLRDYTRVWWNDEDTTKIKHIDKEGVFYVWVENEQACRKRSNDMEVIIVPMPVPVLADTIEACNGIVLDAKNIGSRYQWSTGETSRKIEVNRTANYVAKISRSDQCHIEDSTFVKVFEAEKPDLGSDLTICRGDAVRLYDRKGVGNADYVWSSGDTLPEIMVYRAGQYELQLHHENACVSRDTIEIVLSERELLFLGDEFTLCDGDQVLLAPSGDFTFYEWGNEQGYLGHSASLNITNPGTYWLTAINEAGCPSYDTVKVRGSDLSFTPLFVVASDVRVGEAVQFRDLSSPPEDLRYRWEFGDATVSYVRDPLHTFYRSDTFQITMHVNNGVCFKTFNKPVIVQGYLKSEQEEDDEIDIIGPVQMIGIDQAQVYPNPFDSYINVEVDLTGKADIRYYLFDGLGRLLYAGKEADVEALYKTLFVGYLPPGMYILKIVAGTSQRHYKLIKNHNY